MRDRDDLSEWIRNHPLSGASVGIVCVEASHADKVAQVDHVGRDAAGIWTTSRGEAFGRPRDSMQVLDDTDKPTTARQRFGGYPVSGDGRYWFGSNERRRFDFTCPLCSLRVVVRGERLDPVLDKFYAHQRGEQRHGSVWLPLSLLSAIVHS